MPEELTAGREDVYLGFFYRTGAGGRMRSRRKRSLSTSAPIVSRGPCAPGFNLYRATPQDVADNEAWFGRTASCGCRCLLRGTARPGARDGRHRIVAARGRGRARRHRRGLRSLDFRRAAGMDGGGAAHFLRRGAGLTGGAGRRGERAGPLGYGLVFPPPCRPRPSLIPASAARFVAAGWPSSAGAGSPRRFSLSAWRARTAPEGRARTAGPCQTSELHPVSLDTHLSEGRPE